MSGDPFDWQAFPDLANQERNGWRLLGRIVPEPPEGYVRIPDLIDLASALSNPRWWVRTEASGSANGGAERFGPEATLNGPPGSPN